MNCTTRFCWFDRNEIVYDLYTGTGTIAQFVSKKSKKSYGVESVPDAIKDANAVMYNIDNCGVLCRRYESRIFNDDFIAQVAHENAQRHRQLS
jgi:23S rRNA (uracil1939-C5)-methyltransferase